MVKGAEARLMSELEGMRRERSMQSVVLANLQTIQVKQSLHISKPYR